MALALVMALGAIAATLARPAAAAGARRRVVGPPPGAIWQYQLQPSASARFASSGGIDLALCAPRPGSGACLRPRVYDIDLYAADGTTPNARAVAAIHRRGGYAICYVDAGTWENWRPDARLFPRSLRGAANGWPGERWLDIRHPALLLRLLGRRVTACRAAGFDGVEFDNVDGYANHTGFPLSAADQRRFDRALAGLAHRAGLAAGLKNDFAQVGALEPAFDFAVDEQCVHYRECGTLRPFVAAGKAVYDVEYSGAPASFCARTQAAGIAAIAKQLALRARPWVPCAPTTAS